MDTTIGAGGQTVPPGNNNADGAGLGDRLERLSASSRANDQASTDVRTARNLAILEAYAAGWSLQQIATRTGLDKSRVHRIVVQQETQQWAKAAQAVP